VTFGSGAFDAWFALAERVAWLDKHQDAAVRESEKK
jgi:hypothetical protein